MAFLDDMAAALDRNQLKVMAWLREQEGRVKAPLYSSVDVRVSDYKIAVIDTNLYPAGFNNIYPRDLQVGGSYVQSVIERNYPGTRKILLIPEDHTRNKPYFLNLQALLELFRHAGYEIEIGSLSPELRKDEIQVEVEGSKPLQYRRAFRQGQRLVTTDFDPDLIILNNDFSQNPPEVLRELEQPVAPPYQGGWHARRKSRHFEILHPMLDEFANLLNLDPWVLQPDTQVVREVDIQTTEGRERLAREATGMEERLTKTFADRGIPGQPHLFLKDNSGTYGFAVMPIARAAEILDLNAKARKKLAAGKGGVKVSEFLIQEGIPTAVKVDECPAEPVIYLVGGEVIGGFFRIHCNQNAMESLNVQGSYFSLLTFSSPLDPAFPRRVMRDDRLLKVCGILGKIASLALGHEIDELLRR